MPKDVPTCLPEGQRQIPGILVLITQEYLVSVHMYVLVLPGTHASTGRSIEGDVFSFQEIYHSLK